MSRGWWRRNALALTAVLVLLPATAATIGLQEWNDYFSGRPSVPVMVESGEQIDFADAAWGPVRAGFARDPSSFRVPADAQLVIIEVPVEPGDQEVGCPAPVLVEAGTGRQWRDSSLRIGLSTYRPDEPVSCQSNATEPYTIYVPYVVPADASGPFWVELSPVSAVPRFLRFGTEDF